MIQMYELELTMSVIVIVIMAGLPLAVVRGHGGQQPVPRTLRRRRLVVQLGDVHLYVGVVSIVVVAGLGRRRRRLATLQRLAHEVRQPLHHHYCREHAAARASLA